MATQADPTAAPRVPLSRERVLRAAVRLADEGGFESLTMRRLGQELGVQAMSLYNHVANKDDIRDGIVELVLGEIEIPSGPDWKASLRRSAISAHDVLVRHPWASGVMHATARIIPARMQWMEAVLRTLREAGFSADMTHHAYHALDSHITGFTLWQVSFPFDTREELAELAEGFLRQIPADEYPHVIEHAHQHLGEPDPGEPSEFEFGLDLLLDGLERIRDAAGHAST
jgi:AcrR family transcriptional regulator